MGLYFRNRTGESVWVAYAYSSPGCSDGGDWAKKGWWRLAPGATAKVRSGFVGGSKFFFYAHGEGGSPEWSGPFVTNLPQQAFDWCWNTAGSSGTDRGLQKLIVPTMSLDHTVVFS